MQIYSCPPPDWNLQVALYDSLNPTSKAPCELGPHFESSLPFCTEYKNLCTFCPFCPISSPAHSLANPVSFPKENLASPSSNDRFSETPVLSLRRIHQHQGPLSVSQDWGLNPEGLTLVPVLQSRWIPGILRDENHQGLVFIWLGQERAG